MNMNMNQVQKVILVPFEEWEKMKTNQEVSQEVDQNMEEKSHNRNQRRKVKKQDTYSEDSFESRKTISEPYSSETELSGEEKCEKNEEGEQEENTSSGVTV